RARGRVRAPGSSRPPLRPADEGQEREAPRRVGAQAHPALAVDAEAGEARQQLLEGDAQLAAREARAEAEVDAEAEGGVRVRRALRVEPLGERERALVAVRGGEGHVDARALRDRDAADLDVARRHPRETGHRRLEAQELLDRAAEALGAPS